MRYGLVPDTPEEARTYAAGELYTPVIDLLMPLVQARSIMAAVRLGVFEALGGGPRGADEIAAACSLDAASLELLLRVLACAGYVARAGERYDLTPLARESMLRASPRPLHGFAEFNYVQWEWLGRLEEVLQTGTGCDFHGTAADPRVWETYQRAMLEAARFEGPLIAPRVPVKAGASRLLDIGGSHGWNGALLCRRHAGLRAEVLDLPAAVEHARRLAREAGIDDVVTHRAGNALTDDLGAGWDVILLSSLAHHFSSEQNTDLARRVRAALGPGGTFAIVESERPAADARPDLMADGFALLFRLLSTARCYTAAEIAGWLRTAGFEGIETERPAPGLIVVHGRAGAADGGLTS